MPVVRCNKALRSRVAPGNHDVWNFPGSFLAQVLLKLLIMKAPVPLCSSLLAFLLGSGESHIPARFSTQALGSLAMPDSKPNEKRVSLLKEWLEDFLKPGYVNQRIEFLKRGKKKQDKASEARVLFKPTKQSI